MNPEKTETARNRVLYFDVLRIAATLNVVLLHVAASNWYSADVLSLEWQTFNFYDSISRWGVSVFVMISGALFLDGNHSIKKLYTKYILRIIAAFVFWSFLYSFLYEKQYGLKNWISSFMLGHYHMWFLFMIVGLYMLVPFLKKIAEERRLILYFLSFSLIFNYAIPQMTSIASLFSEGISTLSHEIINKLHIDFVMGFTSLFLLGYYCYCSPDLSQNCYISLSQCSGILR